MTRPKPRCPGCGCDVGEVHDRICDIARCRATGLQWHMCDHRDEAPVPHEPDRWGGRWPGEAECEELGWYSRLVPGEVGFHAAPTRLERNPTSIGCSPRGAGTRMLADGWWTVPVVELAGEEQDGSLWVVPFVDGQLSSVGSVGSQAETPWRSLSSLVTRRRPRDGQPRAGPSEALGENVQCACCRYGGSEGGRVADWVTAERASL